MKSVVLLSGGIDSAVCLWLAKAQGPVWAVNVNYGQVAAESERRRSAMLADGVKASFRHVAIPGLGAALASALTGVGDVAQTVKGLGRNWAWETFVDFQGRQCALPFGDTEAPCGCYDGEDD